jgi:hypothetical protein
MKKLALLAALLAATGVSARAQQIVFANLPSTVTFAGDLLLRHENLTYNVNGKSKADYNDERFYLRYGATMDLGGGFTAAARLASGAGSQATIVQSDNYLSSQKAIWIDRAYLGWQPVKSSDMNLAVYGGKMINPFEADVASQMIWSAYFNPEGYSEKFSMKTGGITLFANAEQMVAANDLSISTVPQNDTANQWMFGEQAGAIVPLGGNRAIKADLGWYKWNNVNDILLDDADSSTYQQQGNRRDNTGKLLNQFSVAEAGLEYTDKLPDTLPRPLAGLPVDVQGMYIKNMAAVNDPAVLGGDATGSDNTGYEAGVVLGQAKAAKTWEAGYFYKMVEADATLSDLVETTYGPGGTNIKGHEVWLAYSPTANTQFKLRYYMTQPVDGGVSTYTGSTTTKTTFCDINRMTLDATFTF